MLVFSACAGWVEKHSLRFDQNKLMGLIASHINSLSIVICQHELWSMINDYYYFRLMIRTLNGEGCGLWVDNTTIKLRDKTQEILH